MPTGIVILLAGRTPSIALELGAVGGGRATGCEEEAGMEDRAAGGLLATGAGTGAEKVDSGATTGGGLLATGATGGGSIVDGSTAGAVRIAA